MPVLAAPRTLFRAVPLLGALVVLALLVAPRADARALPITKARIVADDLASVYADDHDADDYGVDDCTRVGPRVVRCDVYVEIDADEGPTECTSTATVRQRSAHSRRVRGTLAAWNCAVVSDDGTDDSAEDDPVDDGSDQEQPAGDLTDDGSDGA
jgi:hypothetical protein